jgi:iron complex outermembrane receptor protein
MKILIFAVILVSITSSYAEEVQLETIQVLSHNDNQALVNFIPSVSKLSGKELTKRRQVTIGDTLQSEVGVTSTQYGPNASRPVIRGLDGPRIRILQNSLGTLDASTQSVDHNIPIDPLLVDQIEIVRGPMSLLYGSSAVGGVVNIVTNRTHSEFEEGLITEVQTQGETVNNGLSSSARMDYGKDQWMFHIDGATKNLQDQKIPGYARSKKTRQDDPLPPGESEEKNKLDNSFSQQNSIGTGVTRFFNDGFLGLSFGHFDNEYGSVAEKEVSINMIQNRFELHGEHNLNGPFKKIKIRSAQSDYRHKEIEGGATGTIFKNKGNETRIEALNESDSIKGVTGIQTQIFEFEAIGDEAFLPPSDNQIFSLFTFQELTVGKQAISGGGRIEKTDVEQKTSSNFGAADDFGFTALNGSAGYRYQLLKEHSLSFTYSYTERAPSFQELLSNGPHLATGTFEIGDKSLSKEKAHAFELGWKKVSDISKWSLSFYTQRFEDYIALTPNGALDPVDSLPENEYRQTNALFYGVDLDGKQTILQNEKGTWSLLSRFDYVRGKDTKTGDNLPRISPPRVTTGVEFLKNKWSSDIEAQYVFEQSKTAENENATDRYILTNLGTTYTLIKEESKFELFFRIRNIFDVEARNHVSTLKDIAPLAGRNFILGGQILI